MSASAALDPLPYHVDVADRLERLEPAAWRVFASAAVQEGEGSALDEALLRHAYRLEPAGHPRVHAAAARAAATLGLDIPVAIHQLEGGEGPNASLIFRPHEAVVALSGNVLALLGDDELAAALGHELAHHRLWTTNGSRILVADRLLDALTLDPSTPAPYLETARRFDLATELYADRGALLACGDLHVAVAALVKIATGLGEVDPAAFLAQASAAKPGAGSRGVSHPETVLRAWALQRHQAGEGDVAAAALLGPALDLERLDLVDQDRLADLTRSLLTDVLAVDVLRTDAVLGHVRSFFPDLTLPGPLGVPGVRLPHAPRPPSPQSEPIPGVPVATIVPPGATAETRRYLAYVLLDIATIDPDLDDEPLAEAIAIAREAGLAADLSGVARSELTIGERTWQKLEQRAATRRVRAAPEPPAPAPIVPDGPA